MTLKNTIRPIIFITLPYMGIMIASLNLVVVSSLGTSIGPIRFGILLYVGALIDPFNLIVLPSSINIIYQ